MRPASLFLHARPLGHAGEDELRLFPDAPGAAAPSAERRGARGLRLAPLALALAGLASKEDFTNVALRKTDPTSRSAASLASTGIR